MAKNIKTSVVTLPSYWATALVNGDFSGLDADETCRCKAAIERLAPWYVVDVVRDDNGEAKESRFTWHYGLYDPLAECSGGDVLDYVIHRQG